MTTKVILSSHDYEMTPSDEELDRLVQVQWRVGRRGGGQRLATSV